MSYPLHLELAGKRVLVVGAGRVAERRIRGLLAAESDVVVVAPEATAAIRTWAEAGVVVWRQRHFDYSDIIGAWLVHAATDSSDVNAMVADEAARRRIWTVRADEPGDARTPAVAAIDGVTVSVTTGDPRRTQIVRDSVALGIQDGSLSARPRRARDTGSVVLIGGGPGNGDLITVRGRRELLTADVVVYDRLAPTELLELVDPDVELIDAAKAPGHHTLSQEEINAVLIDRARQGLRVARLKGGDPFVLGRGSEELIACTAAGLPVEVIPGVTSAVSGPAAAGIPVTHRGLATGFVVISGHALGDLTPFAATDLTLVVLMGVGRLGQLAATLLDAGRAPSTPVAVIERAYSTEQRVTTGDLATIATIAEREGVANPAIIVVGDVVSVPTMVAEAARTAETAAPHLAEHVHA